MNREKAHSPVRARVRSRRLRRRVGAGLAVGRDLHRGCGAQPILVFESDGTFVRGWGEGLFSNGKVLGVAPEDRAPGASGYTAVYGPAGCRACGAHGIRVDPEGNV